MGKQQRNHGKPKRIKPFVISAIIVLIAISAIMVFVFVEETPSDDNSVLTENQRNVGWLHVHGLGLDPSDNSILYIATHGAFYQSISGSPPVKIGNSRDDFMAFNAPPVSDAPMYASGHPARGGNTGLIKSTDGGRTWETVSSVLQPPVDFHAMSVSKSDPNIILGFDSGGRGLFKTTDFGKTWENLEYPEYISALAISPNDSELIFAGTGKGMYRSDDGGNSWNKVSYNGQRVLSLAIDDDTLYAFSPETGLERSFDFGQNWEKIAETPLTVTSIAIDPQNKDMYLGGMHQSGSQEVYKLSSDLQTSFLIGTNRN